MTKVRFRLAACLPSLWFLAAGVLAQQPDSVPLPFTVTGIRVEGLQRIS